jgi:hypothetical protein
VVANLLKLKEIVKGERLGDGSKSSTLPANELLGRDVQNPKDVRSTISVHVSSESPAELVTIIGGITAASKCKTTENSGKPGPTSLYGNLHGRLQSYSATHSASRIRGTHRVRKPT